jgi:hypothetical protein
MPLSKDYLDILKERSKKSRVYRKYQMVGLMLAEVLKDEKHRALYIKLAKQHDEDKLMDIARKVAEKTTVANKGAYFMRVLFGKKTRKKTTEKK